MKFMYQKISKLLFPLALILMFIVACGSAANEQNSGDDSVNGVQEGEGATDSPDRALRIYNWDTYIDPDILTDFEREFDVTIQYELFESNEDMLTQIENGAVFDVIVPSDYMVEYMREEGLLRELHHENIPNINNLDPTFASPIFDPGNRFCVAYQWGTLGIGYNRAAVGKELTGFEQLFDEEHAGRIALIDDLRSMLGVTLIYLGYSPNTSNVEQIAEAVELLAENDQQFIEYAPDTGQDMLLSGEADIVFEWSGDIFQAIDENPDIQYVIPEEGSIIWTDNLCIPANANNPELAEKFINYILRADVGAQLSNYVRYGAPNLASRPMLLEEDRKNPAIYPPEEVQKRLFFLADLDQTTAQSYEDAWATLVQ